MSNEVKIVGGINWIWYECADYDTLAHHFRENVSEDMPEWMICKLNNGMYGYRIHR